MKRLLQDIRKYRWHLIVALGVFVAARWVYNRGKPQRVMELITPPQALYNGKVYLVDRNPVNYEATITAVSVDGGASQILAKENVEDRVLRILSVSAKGICYGLFDRARQGASMPRPPVPRPQRTAIVKSIPSEGGSPVELPGQPHSSNLQMIGDMLFWIDPKPDEVRQVKSQDRLVDRHYPRSDLVMARVTSGPEKRYPAVASQRSRLMAGEEAVYWTVTAPEMDKEVDLYRMAPNGDRPSVFARYPGEPPPVELAGRLYWIETYNPDAPNAPPPESRIISANMDGADRRTVYKLVTQRTVFGTLRWSLSQLSVYKGSLFVVASKTFDRREAAAGHPAALYRYAPGASSGLEKVCDFKEHISFPRPFDGGYYYFLVVEERENLFDFSSKGLYLNRVLTLYRYRLPE